MSTYFFMIHTYESYYYIIRRYGALLVLVYSGQYMQSVSTIRSGLGSTGTYSYYRFSVRTDILESLDHF